MTKTELPIKMLFKLPPEKAVEYLNKKGYKITHDWREMWEDAHTKAFTISKMADAQLLKDSKQIIDKAISEGWGTDKAERELKRLYIKKGWWGKRIDVDSKGNAKVVQLGSPRRVRTIFRTNLETAISAQRYLDQLEDVDFAPYWEYKAVLDNRTRPSHRALNGKVFRYDDEFWDKFYPPNGWGCRCYVVNLTEKQLKQAGLSVEKSKGKLSTEDVDVGSPDLGTNDTDTDNGQEGQTTSATENKKKENIKQVSVYRSEDLNGQINTTKTDAGWNYNVGKYAWNLDVLAYKAIAQLPEKMQDNFISAMARNPHRRAAILATINNMLAKNFRKAEVELTITWLSPMVLKFLKNSNNKPVTPVISFERSQVSHSINPTIKVPKQMLTEQQFKHIYDYLNEPDEVFYDPKKKQLLYVKFLPKDEIENKRNCIKIPVIINTIDPDRPTNYIGTTGRVNYNDVFNNPDLIKIE